MFDYAATIARQEPQQGGANPLVIELRRLGFELLQPGMAERISVREVLRTGACGSSLLQRLANIANSSHPLCLTPVDFGDTGDAIHTWQRFCEILRESLPPPRSASSPGFCLHSHQLPLEAYCLIADAILGKGPRYLFLDSLQMEGHCNRLVEERTASNWMFLWRNRLHDRPVMPVYGGMVRSPCPLLSDEVAMSVLPVTGLQVPDNSAWLSVRLLLPHFAGASGRLDEERLLRVLRQAIRLADLLLEQQRWRCPLQRADAKSNRRLAVIVSGIGDLVCQEGRDPRDLASLRWLGRIIRRMHGELCKTSGRMAEQHGAIPALNHAHPDKCLPDGPHGAAWRSRFETAARKSAIRHRNLLAISPYSVLPTTRRFDTAFTDLLPIIAHADAWSFANPPAFTGWNATQFQHFHRRARAIIQGSQAASFVAAGV